MNSLKLSSREDWEKHWNNHELIRIISERFSWHDQLKRVAREIGGGRAAIELGGFPGNFSVYLKKYCNLNVTLIDYIVDPNVVEKLFEINGLKFRDVNLIEADVFSYDPERKYDLVCSFGLIEHFVDLEKILQCHLKFMNLDGILLITLPNFTGVNGFLQYLFDRENLAIHNLKIMDIKLLKSVLIKLGLKKIDVQYYPSTQVWLEGLKYRSFLLKILVRVVNKLVFIFSNILGKKNKFFSDSIVIIAKW